MGDHRMRESERVTSLRTTVIMKTDISGSTTRFRALPESDLHALLSEHRKLVTDHAAAHGGYIVKPEGDGFWLVFPSVTGAALAAMTMQEELRLAQPNRFGDRLTMRIVLAVGDVLQEEGALVGDAVVLSARIEAITPPDEIYLSTAAWLVVNRAEVRTALVDTFTLKGFPEPVAVYRVEQTHRTRVIADQYTVFADLRAFTTFAETVNMTIVEKVLDTLSELIALISRDFGGTVRFNVGDAHCVTFEDAGSAMTAAEGLHEHWNAFQRRERIGCPMILAVHRGMLYAFRSYFYGHALVVAARVLSAGADLLSPGEGAVFVTEEVRRDLAGTPWEQRLQRVDTATGTFGKIGTYRLAKSDSNDEPLLAPSP